MHLFGVCHIAGYGQALPTEGTDLAHERFDFIGATGGNGDIRTSLSQGQSNTAANAATSASDNGSPPRKHKLISLRHHRSPFEITEKSYGSSASVTSW
jgi:hypothetical protein